MIERRGPGRPPRLEPRAETRHVRLETDVDDALSALSKRHDITVHALLRLAARHLTERPAEDIAKELSCISGGF